jgi:hypothetical protein
MTHSKLTKTAATSKSVYPDYKAKLAARRKAMKNYSKYLAHCKKFYPGGSLSK